MCESIHADKRGVKREEARLPVGVVDVDPTVTLGSPLSHPWVTPGSTVGSTLGQPGSTSGEWWLIQSFVIELMSRCHIYIYTRMKRALCARSGLWNHMMG